MMYTLTIPGWHPARLNQWQGRHWAVSARLKKRDRQRVGLESLLQGIPKGMDKKAALQQTLLTENVHCTANDVRSNHSSSSAKTAR